MSSSLDHLHSGLRWRDSARRLAGRYRRRSLWKGSPPLDLLRLALRHFRFARNIFLSLHRTEVGARGNLSGALAPLSVLTATSEHVESSTPVRRETRLERTRLRVETRLRPNFALHRHRRTTNVTFRALSISTNVRRSENRRRFVSLFPELRVSREAARAGRRIRERLARNEALPPGETKILIARSASAVPVSRQPIIPTDEVHSLVDGTAPATWQAFGTQSLDYTRLTDEVLRQIDRRVVARRERLGRI
jgi:predicted nucleic acid-binding protein